MRTDERKPADVVTSLSLRLDSFDHAPEVRAALLGILTPDEISEGIEWVRPSLRKSDPQVGAAETDDRMGYCSCVNHIYVYKTF